MSMRSDVGSYVAYVPLHGKDIGILRLGIILNKSLSELVPNLNFVGVAHLSKPRRHSCEFVLSISNEIQNCIRARLYCRLAQLAGSDAA